jgi:hypothetical protein
MPSESYTEQRSQSKFMHQVKQSIEKHTLLKAVRADMFTAVRDSGHRAAIRRLDIWSYLVKRVKKQACPSGTAEYIADALAAAWFWADNVIQTNVRDPDHDLPFDAHAVRRLQQYQARYYKDFKRRSKRPLQYVKTLRDFLKGHEGTSQGFDAALRACERFITQIEDCDESMKPLEHGSQFQGPNETQPQNLAAALIYRLLRQKGLKQQKALQKCHDLLCMVFPPSENCSSDAPLEGLRQRIWRVSRARQRSTRKKP